MVDRRDEVVVDDRRHVAAEDRSAGSGTTAVAWIALIVALLALTLAWMAFNRTGEDLEDRIQDAVNQSAQTVEEATRDTSQSDVEQQPVDQNPNETELNNPESSDPDQPVQEP